MIGAYSDSSLASIESTRSSLQDYQQPHIDRLYFPFLQNSHSSMENLSLRFVTVSSITII